MPFLDEKRNCSNCNDEDTDREDFPCSKCSPYILNNWSPKQEEGADLWDM